MLIAEASAEHTSGDTDDDDDDYDELIDVSKPEKAGMWTKCLFNSHHCVITVFSICVEVHLYFLFCLAYPSGLFSVFTN